MSWAWNHLVEISIFKFDELALAFLRIANSASFFPVLICSFCLSPGNWKYHTCEFSNYLHHTFGLVSLNVFTVKPTKVDFLTMYKPALILATLRYFTYSWGVHKTLKRSYLLGWTTRVCVLLAHRSPKVMYSKKSIAKMFYYTGWIFSQMLTAMNKAWKKYIYHIISINLNLSTWVYIFIVRYQS